jgi:hypothetical protein
MKVALEKHGGQAAAIYLGRPPLIVDTDTLPKASADELARLVAATKAAPPSQAPGFGIPGDVMSYTITVGDGGSAVILKQSDITMSPAFAALLRWLESHFGPGRLPDR